MRKNQRIVVTGITRRDPDYKLYTEVLMSLARQKAKDRRTTETGEVSS